MTESTQNADFRRKPQIFADSPLLLEIPAIGGRRKPQIFAENRRKPQIGLCHLRSVTFSSVLITDTDFGRETHEFCVAHSATTAICNTFSYNGDFGCVLAHIAIGLDVESIESCGSLVLTKTSTIEKTKKKCWITKAKAKDNPWDLQDHLAVSRKCGLLLWLVRTQHVHRECQQTR